MVSENNKLNFKLVSDPTDTAILTATVDDENGVIIKHSDYFYKNVITVTTNGETHTITTPNGGFIFISIIFVLIILTAIAKFIKNNFVDIKYLKEKYPLVSEEFMKKTEREQLIENNQEIHKINIRTEKLEEDSTKITNIIEILQNKLNQDK